MHTERAQPRSQQGFTLMEILVVVIIIAILATIAVPQFMDAPGEARQAKAQQDIRAIESALQRYKLDNYHYPSTEQGLDALVSAPAGQPAADNWREGGYLKRLPEDPWGQPYRYINPGRNGDVDIYTLGRDGQQGGEGEDADVGNWQL